MLNASDFRNIVSGQRRGLRATLWRALFRVVELPHTWGVRIRNHRYDNRRAEVCRVSVPVVSVGNLTTGGTGKTPMVEWLSRWFRDRNMRVSLISRGYGAERGALNDEAMELEQKLPDVPHLQNPDRVEAARVAIEEFDTELIIMDDGFQHRRIHRDLDIVLIDSLEPFGYGHLLPRGMLREPLSGLRRADAIALTRADMVSPERRHEIQRKARRHNPDAVWIEVSHAPNSLISSKGDSQPLESLRDTKVAAFCGIGNPAGFRHTLESCGCDIAWLKEFPDHCRYRREDLDRLADLLSESNDIERVICTHKDLVKVAVERIGGHDLWALQVGIEVLSGLDELEQQLAAVLPGHQPRD